MEFYEDLRRSLVFRIERNKAMTMRKMSVGVLVLLMAMGLSVCYGQDEGFTVDNEFSTKYMWRGFDLFDDHPAWFVSTDIDLSEQLGEGWSLNVWYAQPWGSGSEEFKELDYTVSFSNTVNDGEMDEMEYSVGWLYYDFYEANKDVDAHEAFLGMSWPNALKCGEAPLVPSFFVAQFWPIESGDTGTYYNFRLDMDVECPDTGQVFGLYSDISYNDGMLSDDSEFSHISFGVSTDCEVMGVEISPYINYQISMDDSVNSEDELWGGLSTSITF